MYFLVSEDFMALVFCLGIFFGWMILPFLVWILQASYKSKMKQFYLESEDYDREQMLGRLEAIKENWRFLAVKTNTRKARSEYNHLLDLINLLKKKRLD